MTSLAHALIGATIAAKFPHSMGLVAGISLFTHFACDCIPHWDLGTNWRLRPRTVTGLLALGETALAVGGTFFLFVHFVPSAFTLLVAIIFSLLPDWLEAPYFILLPKAPKIFYYIYKMQSVVHEKLCWPWGILTQIATVAAFLIVGFAI